MTRCQICGRRRGTGKAGQILMHHVRGLPCPGTGFPPIEIDDSRLETLLVEVEAAERVALNELVVLYDQRANYIDPALIRRYGDLSAQSARIQRRIARHRAWPQRFERQMERQGWGYPPPAYLLAREARP